MPTIAQWENDISVLSDEELQSIETSLDKLKSWNMFETAFSDMAHIRLMINHEHTSRLLARHDATMSNVDKFVEKVR